MPLRRLPIRRHSFVFALAGIISVSGTALRAQDAPLTLPQAVRQAVDRYPAVRAATAQVDAAAASAALARDAYLPRAHVLWRINRTTRNNTSGLLLPQAVIPAISGAVTPESGDSIWNHAPGVLVAWEPLDFGYRSGMVKAADAAPPQSRRRCDRNRARHGQHASHL